MAHHYGEYFINYNFPKPPVEKNHTSGSVEKEQSEHKEEIKEAKCSSITK
jgi:hypothetical protein|tara:strand:- start:599 stop:748 length:150 start_codon:yes stop_codon:yes gene_type:complete